MPTGHDLDCSRVAVVIPALNEAENLRLLLPQLFDLGVGQIAVGDNGSADGTRAVAGELGADCAIEPRRGYGAACQAALTLLRDDIEVVAFMDADLSDDPAELPKLVGPILAGRADFVLGTRLARSRAGSTMTLPQRFANRLLPALMRLGWGHSYQDLGPYRAIHRRWLDAIGMRDRAYGWTIEMQIRAVEERLRIVEVPVSHRPRRHGRSKVSGSLRGVVAAAYWIIRTCAGLWWTRKRRTVPPPSPGFQAGSSSPRSDVQGGSSSPSPGTRTSGGGRRQPSSNDSTSRADC
ncbi:MAG: glycosyltransferase family 2 protein [Phycisphaerales bacterium]|nr:MAG: glycosyltransferase family 2 protein [Phycisphaerales bacterium]